jgi:protein-S-isoprenylcysteine O-methyltransferase Ste14
MYLAVTMIILGEALVAGSAPLVAYWAVWFVAVNVFVMGFEEPTLRRQFGRAYDAYTSQVRRWIPSLRPRPSSSP